MRFIVQRLGLIFCLLVVAVVLLVPSWRLRATRQWKSPILRVTQLDSTEDKRFGLFPQLETEAARRFPDDPIAQIAPLHGLDFRDIIVASGTKPSDDPRVIRAQNEYFARYENVEKRFPDANIVRAQHLRDVTRGWLNIDPGPQPKVAGEGQLPNRARWLGEAQLTGAIRSARQGARVEPENAYFPWMEAVVEFSLRRDDAAIAALRRAGQCNYFDDYMIRTINARLQLLRRLRAVGWEDEFAEWSGALLPHYAQMRNAARAAMGRARWARKRGDQARALQLAGIVMRAGAVVERTNGMVITKLVGQAICLEAWKAIIENQPNRPGEKPDAGASTEEQTREIEQHNNQIARSFADYCRARQRPDLAREALAIASKFDAKRVSGVYKMPGVQDITVDAEQLSKAFWLGGVALIFGGSASVLWLLCWSFSRRKEDARVRRQSLLWSAFIAGATVVLISATVKFAPPNFFSLWDETEPSDASLLMNPGHVEWVPLLWIAPIAMATLFHAIKILLDTKFWRIERNGSTNWFGIACALVATGFIVGFCGVVLCFHLPSDSLYNSLFPFFGISLVACALVGSAMAIVGSRGLKRVFACFGVSALWTGSVALLFNDTVGDHLFYSWMAASLALVLFLGAFVVALRIWKFAWPAQWKDFVFQFAARTRIAAGVLALLCAVAYAGATLWTIPVERRARAMMERQLQIGEVTWLREQRAARR